MQNGPHEARDPPATKVQLNYRGIYRRQNDQYAISWTVREQTEVHFHFLQKRRSVMFSSKKKTTVTLGIAFNTCSVTAWQDFYGHRKRHNLISGHYN